MSHWCLRYVGSQRSLNNICNKFQYVGSPKEPKIKKARSRLTIVCIFRSKRNSRTSNMRLPSATSLVPRPKSLHPAHFEKSSRSRLHRGLFLLQPFLLLCDQSRQRRVQTQARRSMFGQVRHSMAWLSWPLEQTNWLRYALLAEGHKLAEVCMTCGRLCLLIHTLDLS